MQGGVMVPQDQETLWLADRIIEYSDVKAVEK